MEIILAIVVASAVILFGALISLGNERQRRAIDELREQTKMWAIQDLRIKRERLAREISIDNPIGWLNNIAARATGENLHLEIVDTYEQPQALVCSSREGIRNVVFCLLSPNEINKLKRIHRNRLLQFGEQTPFLSMKSNVTIFELSVLNSGILFDLELPLAWKCLTGQEIERSDCVWMYIMD